LQHDQTRLKLLPESAVAFSLLSMTLPYPVTHALLPSLPARLHMCVKLFRRQKKKKKGSGFHENLILRNYRTFTLTQNIKCCRRPGHVALSFEFFFLLDINPKMTPFQHNYRRERKKRPFPPLSPASHLQWRDIKIDLNSTFLNTPSVSL
jgi:hypothetical protein